MLVAAPPVWSVAMWKAPIMELTIDEGEELRPRVAAHTTSVRNAERAMIGLMAADRTQSCRIAKVVAMHESNVAD